MEGIFESITDDDLWFTP